jgi:predicted negative regulator of RcsB-dependent stress response
VSRAAGWAAFTAADWERAAEEFAAAARADAADAEARDGLGQALWWLGRSAEGIEHGRASYKLHQDCSHARGCAAVAVSLAAEQRIAGGEAAASGWLGLARTDLAGVPECGLHGHVAVQEAARASDPAVAAARARAALEIARRTRDREVELMADARLGLALVSQGAVAEGLALVDAALAALAAGEPAHPLAASEACSAAMLACTRLADPASAAIRAVAVLEIGERRNLTRLLGWCRAQLAAVLVATGDWARAEAELTRALAPGAASARQLGLARLGALRLRQGRRADARELLEACRDPAGLETLAELRLHDGEPAVARALLERRRVAAAADPVARAELLPLRLELALADEDAGGALAVVGELELTAKRLAREDLLARARLGAGRIAARAGRGRAARAELEDAAALFARLRMPFEEGRARVELARLDAGAASGDAVREATAARQLFERLGAGAAAEDAEGLLRELGGTGATAPGGGRAGDAAAKQA